MPTLDNWAVIGEVKSRLMGEVTGHPKFDSGERIVTSSLQMLDVANKMAETKSRSYSLKTPDPEWVAWIEQNGLTAEYYSFRKLN